MREKINFNDGWKFHLGEPEIKVPKFCAKTGTCGGASMLTEEEGFVYHLPPHLQAVFGDGNGNAFYNVAKSIGVGWIDVSVPHDWMIRQTYAEPSSQIDIMYGVLITEGSCGYLPDNVGYYRKVFEVPSKALGKRIVIEFEGVMRDSIVWVNGSYIGSHLSGYTGFAYDITEYLFYGDEGKNVILVKTDSACKEGWWAEGAGIYRDVWLYTLDPVHVKRHGVFIHTKDISDEAAAVVIETEIENQTSASKQLKLLHVFYDPNGNAIAETECAISVDAYAPGKFCVETVLTNPKLWSPEHPYLYTVKTSLLQDGQVFDNCETEIGIREFKYTEKGLLINGKLTEIKGVCEHQDFAGVGIGLTPDIIDYKLKRILDMGANAYRSAHHPATEYLLRACDRLGILVLNENRRLEVNEEGLEDLKELICGSRNHASIFMWSLENEEFITLLPPGKRLLKELVRQAKALDPTRLVTMAGQFAKGDAEYVRIPDVAGFNYDNGDSEAMAKDIPGLLSIASEDSSYVSTRGVYRDDPVAGVCDCYDGGNYYFKMAQMDQVSTELAAGTAGGAVAQGYLVFSWTHYHTEAPQLGGLFVWTAFDYRGETFPWNWPSINSHYGAMDMCGFEKDIFYYWQSVWMDKPIIHVLPHWNWEGDEGRKIQVDAYSNCEEIELFVNGCSQGRKVHTKGLITSWIVVYQPGEIEVVGYNRGQIVARDKRVSAGAPKRIQIETVHEGEKEILVKCTVVDEHGNIYPKADNLIQFTATNGTVIGVGNGHPGSHEPDAAAERKAFNGLAMAIIQKIGNGTVTIAAESEGLETGTLVIEREAD